MPSLLRQVVAVIFSIFSRIFPCHSKLNIETGYGLQNAARYEDKDRYVM